MGVRAEEVDVAMEELVYNTESHRQIRLQIFLDMLARQVFVRNLQWLHASGLSPNELKKKEQKISTKFSLGLFCSCSE